MTLQLKFVESVPEIMEEGVLYVSITYCTVMHLCVCGCGNEVVTRISPADWQLKFDGKSISLNPSIGNWNFDCRSHYWIVNNQVRYAENWSDEKVARGRARERERKGKFYSVEAPKKNEPVIIEQLKPKSRSKLERLKSFFNF
ncbi:MAG: hypothetical protein JWR09_3170 [Mucilaginibacter sp.]|nr:hypothetical protein [Mucilaginibacter sp.]